MPDCRHGRTPLSRMGKEHFRRNLSRMERMEIDILAEGMARAWKTQPPPSAQIAQFASHAFSGKLVPEARGLMSERLRGRPLLDLGAADPAAMMEFASMNGASRYTAVDRYYDYSGMARPGFAELVNDDMLRFVSYQPDGSANVCMNAIDDIVLMSPIEVVELSYIHRLFQEIARVVPPGGMAFGLGSPHLHLLENAGFTRARDVNGESVNEAGAIFLKAF